MAFDPKITGDLLGNLGDMFGIGSAFTDGKTSDGLGLGAGLLGTASAGFGLWDAGKGLKDGKEGAGWDMFDSIMGLGGGLSDITASSAGLAGDEKTKNRSTVASGIFGILGGGGQIIHGIMDAVKNKKLDGDSIMNLVSGTTKAFSGIANVGQGFAPDNDGWKKTGQAASVLGTLANLGGTTKDMIDA